MAFHHHRKLLDEPAPDLVTFCNCDEAAKFNGTCLSTCFRTCFPDSCNDLTIQIPPPPPLLPPPPVPATIGSGNPPGLSLLLTASLAVLATAFFIFTCYTIYKFYTVWRSSRQRRLSQRRQPEEEDGGGGPDDDFLDEDVVDHPIWYIRTVGLQPSVINAITIVNYKKADGLVEGTDCAVCLSEFQEDETLRLLPKCSHAFHIPCIDTWLTSHTNCPMCRAGIAAASSLQDPGRAEEARSEEVDTGVGVEDDVIEVNENIDVGECKVDVDGVQGVRRSVSMDSLSASMISAAVANAFPRQYDKISDDQLVKAKESESPFSGSSSIKRSASCSAKVFLSRHSSRSHSRR